MPKKLRWENLKRGLLSQAQYEWSLALYMALDGLFGRCFVEMHGDPVMLNHIRSVLEKSGNRPLLVLYQKLFPEYKGDIILFTKRYWHWPLPERPMSLWFRANPTQWDAYCSPENNVLFDRALKAKEYQPLSSRTIQRCFLKLTESGKIKPVNHI